MSLPAPPSAHQWFAGINDEPSGPLSIPELEGKIRDGVITGASLVWREGLDDWRPLDDIAELAAVFARSSSARPSPTPMLSTARPSVIAAEAAAMNAVHGKSSKKWLPWAGLLVAALFGGAVTFAALGNSEASQPIVQVARPAPPQPAPPPPPVEKPVEEIAALDAGAEQADAGPAILADTGRPRPARPTSKDNGKKPLVPTLPGLPDLPAGPASGPSGSDKVASSGGKLTSAQLQKTVSGYQGSVKRRCWEPALSTRDRDAPSSARVEVKITIAPSGSVRDVQASGDPRGYAGLSTCIERRIRSWRFPPPGGSQTVKVPFVFAQQ